MVTAPTITSYIPIKQHVKRAKTMLGTYWCCQNHQKQNKKTPLNKNKRDKKL